MVDFLIGTVDEKVDRLVDLSGQIHIHGINGDVIRLVKVDKWRGCTDRQVGLISEMWVPLVLTNVIGATKWILFLK
jgi:hypothetical protein